MLLTYLAVTELDNRN